MILLQGLSCTLKGVQQHSGVLPTRRRMPIQVAQASVQCIYKQKGQSWLEADSDLEKVHWLSPHLRLLLRDCPFEGWQVYRVGRKWSYQLWSSEAECACSWTGKKRGLRWDHKKAFKILWLYFYYQKISSNLDAKRVKSHSSNSVNKLLIYWHLLSYFYFSVNNDLALVVSGFIRSVLWLFRKESPT